MEEFIISQIHKCISNVSLLPSIQSIEVTSPNIVGDMQLTIDPLTSGINSDTHLIFTWQDSMGKDYAKMVLITRAANVGDTTLYTEYLDVVIPATAICIHTRFVTVADWSELDVPIEKLVVINITNNYEAARGGGQLTQSRLISIDILALFTSHSFTNIKLMQLREAIVRALSIAFIYPKNLQWRLVGIKGVDDIYGRVDNKVPPNKVEFAYPTHLGCKLMLECDYDQL